MKRSCGPKRQQALRLPDNRSAPKTSLLSCFRAIASSGPADNDEARTIFERVIQEVAPGGVLRDAATSRRPSFPRPRLCRSRRQAECSRAGQPGRGRLPERRRLETNCRKLIGQELWRNSVKSMPRLAALPHLLEVPGRNSPGQPALLTLLGPVAQGSALRSTPEESASGSLLRRAR